MSVSLLEKLLVEIVSARWTDPRVGTRLRLKDGSDFQRDYKSMSGQL